MVKKVVKKVLHKRKSPHKTESSAHHELEHSEENHTEKGMTEKEREDLLIENFVGLQKAMTNLSIKFNALSDNISRLLQVLEEAAKNYAQTGNTDNEDMLKKIDSLLDQNKTIAKGLVLMEGKLRGRAEPPAQFQREFSRPRPRPLPSI